MEKMIRGRVCASRLMLARVRIAYPFEKGMLRRDGSGAPRCHRQHMHVRASIDTLDVESLPMLFLNGFVAQKTSLSPVGLGRHLREIK